MYIYIYIYIYIYMDDVLSEINIYYYIIIFRGAREELGERGADRGGGEGSGSSVHPRVPAVRT